MGKGVGRAKTLCENKRNKIKALLNFLNGILKAAATNKIHKQRGNNNNNKNRSYIRATSERGNGSHRKVKKVLRNGNQFKML